MQKLLILLLLPFIYNEIVVQKSFKINLLEEFKQGKLVPVNRKIEATENPKNQAIRLSEEDNEGLIWLKNKQFSQGTIEIDLKGKDVFQRSFLGLAFHAQNDSTYDAIYFRPFNFYAKDSIRFIHAVQYISHPKFTWKKLRDEQNGKFEKAIQNAPNPNEWFHAKIEITTKEVKVYVENRIEPVLIIQKLNNFSTGKIGLFVGDGSGGEFANLTILNKK
jgi:hypothetical protein